MGDIKEGGFQQKEILKKNQSEMLEKYSKSQKALRKVSVIERIKEGTDTRA